MLVADMGFSLVFSAVPLMLYIPPVRCLSLLLEAMEDMLCYLYTHRCYPQIRQLFFQFRRNLCSLIR
ncbi:hypothetical protein Tsubulata_025072 [Turnera subulata]|uniref:Uncharacterized protein n=1 Tax=Turnera subulata TaxID=218843 RepID=A0A9Q0JDY3_9ROSI|nr:hypothetical protein Tsubulata_025072 [Turnera subulata]